MVLPVGRHAAAVGQRHARAVAEHKAGVALATLHAGGWRQVAEEGEEVRASGGAGGTAVRVVAVGVAWHGWQGGRQGVWVRKVVWLGLHECLLFFFFLKGNYAEENDCRFAAPYRNNKNTNRGKAW